MVTLMKKKRKAPLSKKLSVEKISNNATQWIGSPQSLIAHTILFAGIFSLAFFGIEVDKVLLVLTTILSLEAIYLAIFIQMTVNRNTLQLHEVEKEIEDIHEEVEEISEDIEEIQEDVEEISGDIEEIQEDVEEISDGGENSTPSTRTTS